MVSRKVRVLTSPTEIERTLRGRDLQIFRDHTDAAAARHVVLVRGDEYCYVVYRRDRRKRLPLFASILYVSDRDLFRDLVAAVLPSSPAPARSPVTLAESRVVGSRPRWSVTVAGRPKMYLGDDVDPTRYRLPVQRTHQCRLVTPVRLPPERIGRVHENQLAPSRRGLRRRDSGRRRR